MTTSSLKGVSDMAGLNTLRALLGVLLATAIGITSGVVLSPTLTAFSAPVTQENVLLNQRLRILEQRLQAIELNINQLQQQVLNSQRSSTQPSAGRDPEVIGLRTEVETFSRRLVEIECGLVKLDERTNTPAAREALRRLGDSGTDPCRRDATAPIRLSSRP